MGDVGSRKLHDSEPIVNPGRMLVVEVRVPWPLRSEFCATLVDRGASNNAKQRIARFMAFSGGWMRMNRAVARVRRVVLDARNRTKSAAVAQLFQPGHTAVSSSTTRSEFQSQSLSLRRGPPHGTWAL